jgi:hypothetical protein
VLVLQAGAMRGSNRLGCSVVWGGEGFLGLASPPASAASRSTASPHCLHLHTHKHTHACTHAHTHVHTHTVPPPPTHNTRHASPAHADLLQGRQPRGWAAGAEGQEARLHRHRQAALRHGLRGPRDGRPGQDQRAPPGARGSGGWCVCVCARKASALQCSGSGGGSIGREPYNIV